MAMSTNAAVTTRKCVSCGAEMDQNVVFCPNCGKKNPKDTKPFYKKWWFIAIVGLVLAGAILDTLEDNNKNKIVDLKCGDLAMQIDQPNSIKERDAFAMSAEELSRAYGSNEFAAKSHFYGDNVILIGEISAIENEYLFSSNKTLKIRGAGEGYPEIQCHFTEEHVGELMNVGVGDKVAVRGVISERAYNLNIRDSQILDSDKISSIYDDVLGDMLLSIDEGAYAGTQYYVLIEAIKINSSTNTITVPLVTIPRNDFASKLSEKYMGLVSQVNRTIMIELTMDKNKYKCTDYSVSGESIGVIKENCEDEWRNVEEGTTIDYIIKALHPYIGSVI